jgi:hypothetical protein
MASKSPWQRVTLRRWWVAAVICWSWYWTYFSNLSLCPGVWSIPRQMLWSYYCDPSLRDNLRILRLDVPEASKVAVLASSTWCLLTHTKVCTTKFITWPKNQTRALNGSSRTLCASKIWPSSYCKVSLLDALSVVKNSPWYFKWYCPRIGHIISV